MPRATINPLSPLLSACGAALLIAGGVAATAILLSPLFVPYSSWLLSSVYAAGVLLSAVTASLWCFALTTILERLERLVRSMR